MKIDYLKKELAENEEFRKAVERIWSSESKPMSNGKKPSNKPLYRFQCGNVATSVFPHEYVKDGVMCATFNVAIDRGYTDTNGNWKSSKTFRVTDLHKVITVAQKAWEAAAMVNGNGETDG